MNSLAHLKRLSVLLSAHLLKWFLESFPHPSRFTAKGELRN